MTKRRMILLMSLGGAVYGGILGVVGGAFLGAIYGAITTDLSWGFDGAFLGGCLGGFGGAVYGLVLGLGGDPKEIPPDSSGTRPESPVGIQEAGPWQQASIQGPERSLLPENRHLSF